MEPINFARSNTNFGPPKGWDELGLGPCRQLHIRKRTNGTCESHWCASYRDILTLLLGGTVRLTIAGGQPPVALEVVPKRYRG